MRASLLACLLASLPMVAGAQSSRPATRRAPNVVLIVADDLGWGELGCYGQARIATPACDRIAAQGMRFTDAYSGAPVCAPARCVLLTGRHAGHAAIRDNQEVGDEGQAPLPAGTVTLATLLRGAGYATACIGKWGLGGPGSTGEPLAQGFDRFYGFLCQRKAHDHYPAELWRDRERVVLGHTRYAQDLFVAEVRAWLAETRDRPFFLLFTPTVPHLALQAPDAAVAPYRGRFEEKPYDGKRGYVANATPRATYAAMVAELDRGVAAVLDALAASGRDADTLVLVTSDNGPTHDVGGADTEFFRSAGPLRGRKGSCWEGGIRVPLLARWPGVVAAGGVCARPTGAPDVLPTLCEIARAGVPVDADGGSFAGALRGEQEAGGPRALYWEFPGYGGWQAVRLARWKGVRQRLGSDPRAPLELYDLEADLGETKDVARTHPDIVAELERIARLAHAASDGFAFPALDAAGGGQARGR